MGGPLGRTQNGRAALWLRIGYVTLITFAVITAAALYRFQSARLVEGTTPWREQTIVAVLIGLVLAVALTFEVAIRTLHRQMERLVAAELASARLASIAQQTSSAAIITDAQGLIEWVNPGFTRISGYTLDEVRGRAPGDFLQGPATDASAKRLMHDAVVAGCDFRTEIVNYSKDGTPYWITIDAQPLFGSDGKLSGFVAVETDVTERKHAEQQLRAVTERLRLATSAAEIGTWEFDLVNGTLAWDEQVHTLFGTSPDSFSGRYTDWTRALHPDDAAAARAAFLQAVATRTPMDTSFRIIRPDGAVRYIKANCVIEYSADHMPLRAIGVNYDITAQREAELRLQQSEDLLRQMGALTRSGGWSFDLTTRVLTWTDEVYRIHELTPGCVPSFERAKSFYPQPGRDELESVLAKAAASGTPFDTQLPFVTAQGNRRWVRTICRPYMESGRVIRLQGALQDITEQRETERRLSSAMERAQAANRAKSAFLANMSHEIRTPMSAVLGYAELLQAEELTEPERAEYLGGIRRAGQHLLELINDVLDLSKIEAGRLEVERVNVSLRQIVDEVTSITRTRAEVKGLRLSVELVGALPDTIRTDPTRLRQILTNLAGNAVKFTSDGGVRIVVKRADEDGRTLRFEVLDTGIGIPPAKLSLLFRPFTQVDVSHTRRFGGTGLGLAISQRLAQALGGRIEVNSVPGEGSAFMLILPCAVDANGACDTSTRAASVAATDGPALLTGRVLLAEDGADNQRLFGHILRRAGLELVIVETGVAALEAVGRADRQCTPFGLILMDMQMPEMDGYTATQRLRSTGCRTPIVALTAHAMAGDRERCLAAGCNDYASKPITRERLLKLCGRYLQNAEASPGHAPTGSADPQTHRHAA